MSNTVTLSQSAYKNLLARMNKLEKMIATLLERFEQEPLYGSEAWWDWSNKKGKQDIEKGDYYELRNKKDIDNFFKNIESGQTNEQFHHKIRGQG